MRNLGKLVLRKLHSEGTLMSLNNSIGVCGTNFLITTAYEETFQ